MIHKLENPARIEELAPANTLIKIGLSEGKIFCDVGAGTGVFTLPAVEISKPVVYAVEISEQMRGVLLRKNVGNSIHVVDNIRAMPVGCCDIDTLKKVLNTYCDFFMRE